MPCNRKNKLKYPFIRKKYFFTKKDAKKKIRKDKKKLKGG